MCVIEKLGHQTKVTPQQSTERWRWGCLRRSGVSNNNLCGAEKKEIERPSELFNKDGEISGRRYNESVHFPVSTQTTRRP